MLRLTDKKIITLLHSSKVHKGYYVTQDKDVMCNIMKKRSFSKFAKFKGKEDAASNCIALLTKKTKTRYRFIQWRRHAWIQRGIGTWGHKRLEVSLGNLKKKLMTKKIIQTAKYIPPPPRKKKRQKKDPTKNQKQQPACKTNNKTKLKTARKISELCQFDLETPD